jgi:integrase
LPPLPILQPGEKPATPEDYLAIYCLERGLARKSQDQLRYKLTSFERYLRRPATWNDLNDTAVNLWLAMLCESKSSLNSVRTYRAGVLAIWRGAYEARIIDVAPQRIRRIKRRAQRPTAWTMADLDKLLKTCGRLEGQMRRASSIAACTFWTAYVLLGYYVGLRLADMLALRWSDISTEGILTVVQGKSGDLVACQLPPDVLEVLSQLHGDGRQRVFGDIIGRTRLLEFFRRLVRAAGLQGTSKWLRKSGASHVEAMMPGGARGFLGHRSDISLAYAYYVDPGIAMRLKPLPPRIEREKIG